jgi:hypothetical protein
MPKKGKSQACQAAALRSWAQVDVSCWNCHHQAVLSAELAALSGPPGDGWLGQDCSRRSTPQIHTQIDCPALWQIALPSTSPLPA